MPAGPTAERVRERRRSSETPITPPDVSPDALRGRRIFGTGISRGTGLITTGVILRAGGEIVGVVRDPARFREEGVPEIQKVHPEYDGKIDGSSGLLVIQGDVIQPNKVISVYDDVAEQGFAATDVVHMAAGGMEAYLAKLGMVLGRARRPKHWKDRKAALDANIPQLQRWAAESWPAAYKINFEGPAVILDAMAERLPRGGRIVNYTSLPTSFLGSAEVGLHYLIIAGTKILLMNHAQARAGELTEGDIQWINQSGSGIKGTGVGNSIEGLFMPVLPPKPRKQLAGTFIDRMDMALTTFGVLVEDSTTWPNPLDIYIVGPDKKPRRDLTADSPQVRGFKMPI